MQHIKSSHRTLSRGLLKSINFGESMTITDYGRFPHLSFAYSENQSADTEVPLKNCISSDFCERGQRGGKDLGEVKENCSNCSSKHCHLVGVKSFPYLACAQRALRLLLADGAPTVHNGPAVN